MAVLLSIHPAIRRQPLQSALATETAFLVAAKRTRRVELVAGVRPHSAVHFFLCLPRFSSQRAKDG